MNRKLATWSLGVFSLMFVLALTVPASATFTQDTMLLNTNDTFSKFDTDPAMVFDVATDSTGNIYVLFVQRSSASAAIQESGAIRVNKFDPSGGYLKTLTAEAVSRIPVRKGALAVNKTSGAIYIAVADSTIAYLYADTDASTEASGADHWDSTDISEYRLANMTNAFGFIDVAVFGTSSTDSVFVIGLSDSISKGPAAGAAASISDAEDSSGVRLWRFNNLGGIASTDSVTLYNRVDTIGTRDSSVLRPGKIISKAQIIALSASSIGVLLQGPIDPFLNGGKSDTFPSLETQLGDATDTEVDTGLFYDTWLVRHAVFGGKMGVASNSGVDTIFTAGSRFFPGQLGDTQYIAADMIWDADNGRVVIFYNPDPTDSAFAAKLRRITISGSGRLSQSNNTDLSSSISIGTSDTQLTGVAVSGDASGNMHVALRTRNNAIYYYKHDTSGTLVDFDTVAQNNGTSASDSNAREVRIALTTDKAPRVVYARTQNGGRHIMAGRQQGVAVTTTNVTVVSSQTVSSGAGSPSVPLTLTVSPTVTDSSAVFTQVVLSATSATQANTSSITDFSNGTPTYVVAAPLGNANGDTLVLNINSTVSGLQVLLSRPLDTNPDGGFGSSLTSDLDTSNLGGLTDTMFQVCAATAVEIRLGRSDGTVFADNAISDTVALRLKFVLTQAYLAGLVAAGVDTSALTVWSLSDGESKLTEIGNSTTASEYATDLNNGGELTFTSNTMTSLSHKFNLPHVGGAGSSGGGGVCVVGRCVGSSSPVAASIRAMRDTLMSTRLGRVLTSIYYNLK